MLGVLLHTMAISGLSHVRTELVPLLIVPTLAHHPVQTNCQLRAIATLAVFRPRRIIRWRYLLRHSGTLRTVTGTASTSKKRIIELPCLVMCPRCQRELRMFSFMYVVSMPCAGLSGWIGPFVRACEGGCLSASAGLG